MPMPDQTITFVGGGNMAAALIGGLVHRRFPVQNIRVVEPRPEARQALAERLPFTLTLAALSMLVATIVGVTLGSIAASAAGTFLDRAILVMSLVGIAMPGFWVGLVMMFYFAVDLGWFPTGGYTPPIEGVVPWLRSLALPVFSLALLESALITRMTRASRCTCACTT